MTAFARLAKVARIERGFDGLVELLLTQYRDALNRQAGGRYSAEQIDSLCSMARERLELYRSEYLLIIESEWTSFLSAQELEDLAAFMDQPVAERYFSVSLEIEPRMKPAFENLAQSMLRSMQASAI